MLSSCLDSCLALVVLLITLTNSKSSTAIGGIGTFVVLDITTPVQCSSDIQERVRTLDLESPSAGSHRRCNLVSKGPGEALEVSVSIVGTEKEMSVVGDESAN